MKNLYIYILVFISVLLTSCTDVIDVDVPIAPPRLVIEASLDWEKGTTGNEQTVILSQSTPYFDSGEVDYVAGATVKVTNTNSGEEFLFTDQGNGQYTTTSFVPVINDTYELEVLHDGETYTATEVMTPVVDIDDVFQSTENGFDPDVLEVNVQYTDPANIENFYLFKFQLVGDLLPELQDLSDEFTDGNQITIFNERDEDEDTGQKEYQPGDVVDISFYGISQQYFNYIRLLISQSDSNGPFSATPVAVKGNCINPDNPEAYAFGYFRVTQVVKTSYTFTE
ncbi:DUF4249 domain-containing protein [Urechidicola sp. KH5]